MKAKDIKRISDAGKMGYDAGVKIRQTVVWRCKDIGSADSFIKILEEDCQQNTRKDLPMS